MMNNRSIPYFYLLLILVIGLSGCAKDPNTAEINAKYEAHTKQANDALAEKNYSQAVDEYSKAIAVKPETEAYKKRASAYEAQGNHESAIQDYYAVLDRDQESAEAWYGLGLASIATKNYSTAGDAFRKASKLKPDYAEPYYGRGLLNKAQGDKDEAIAAFKKYLEIGKDPALRDKAQAELKELSSR
jgi:tetratricopeptide (TPR) repeat protein